MMKAPYEAPSLRSEGRFSRETRGHCGVWFKRRRHFGFRHSKGFGHHRGFYGGFGGFGW